MKITWPRYIEISGYRGNQVTCRSDEEAATLVLELILAGVKRYEIIIDGQYLKDKGTDWIWKALDA